MLGVSAFRRLGGIETQGPSQCSQEIRRQFGENQFQPEWLLAPCRRGLSGCGSRRSARSLGSQATWRPAPTPTPAGGGSGSWLPYWQPSSGCCLSSLLASPLPRLPSLSSLQSPSLPPPSPRGGDRRACNLVPFARLEQHLPPSLGTRGSHPKPYKEPKTNPGPQANNDDNTGRATGARSTHSTPAPRWDSTPQTTIIKHLLKSKLLKITQNFNSISRVLFLN